MSVTNRDADAIVTVLEALFDLDAHPSADWWRQRRSERRLRDAACHLAGRALRQLQTGPDPELLLSVPLRVT
jgi:hypothetical protein